MKTRVTSSLTYNFPMPRHCSVPPSLLTSALVVSHSVLYVLAFAPLGPDYVVGVGDTLTINLWGGVTQSITRSVDRDGRIFLPEAGSIQIAGLSLGQAESLIGSELKQQFRNAQVAVTVSRLRSVRVYVVGDVQRPGGYDISALATPLSALFAAGGPTDSLMRVLTFTWCWAARE